MLLGFFYISRAQYFSEEKKCFTIISVFIPLLSNDTFCASSNTVISKIKRKIKSCFFYKPHKTKKDNSLFLINQLNTSFFNRALFFLMRMISAILCFF